MDNTELILAYWFGDNPQANDPDYWEKRNPLWFGFDENTDREISKKFEPLLSEIKTDDFSDWGKTPTEQLALILLSDQFSRNIYRGSLKAFSHDHIALEQCKKGLETGQYKELHPVHQVFYFMPLEHSENLDDQNLCIKLLEETKASSPAELLKILENFQEFAIQHRDIIEKFGRFPHRNKILGRMATEQEKEYLATGGATYGQG